MRSVLKFWGIVGCGLVLGAASLGAQSPVSAPQVSKKALEYRLEGYRYQQQGDYDNAVLYYRKALEAEPKYATAHNDLGIVYEQQGMYEAAERSYTRAIKISPDYKGAYSNLAYLYENSGDVDKSIYYWKRRLSLEQDQTSKWADKAKQKLAELQQRRSVREVMSNEERIEHNKIQYENKRKTKFNGWVPKSKDIDIEEEMGQRYFDQGVKLYSEHRYEDALAAFRMARTYNVHEKDASKYMVKINKVREAMAKSDITGDKPYENIVSKEDLLLARDHFKMGLDFYGAQDYERAFSSFTMAMTYNPYDEIIQRYVEDSKIKIEEIKVKSKLLRKDAARSSAAGLREPGDVRRDMVRTRDDMVNKGFVTTSEDMSVESFLKDGKDLFIQKRYEDALYVWKQALLLDISGVYHDELESLIDQADIASEKDREKRYDAMAEVTEEKLLSKVTQAAVPSKAGAPDWALKVRSKRAKPVKEEHPDMRAVKEKLQTRYTLNFDEASLKGVVDLLAELTGLNIVIDSKEITKEQMENNHISFRVADMPLQEILEAILRFTDFDYLIEKNLIWITTKDKIRKEDIVMVVYDVQDIIGKIFDFPSEELGQGFSRREGSTGLGSNSNTNSTNE